MSKKISIVFSDIDGTLLTTDQRILPGTLKMIRELRKREIPFVIVSARSPGGIRPILKEYKIQCPIVAFSGALILDENEKILFSKGMSRDVVGRVVEQIESSGIPCSWNLYSAEKWIVKDKSDPNIIQEEEIVKDSSDAGSAMSFDPDEAIGKIMCICEPENTEKLEAYLKPLFPDLAIVKSFDTLLEIMQTGVSKGEAVKKAVEYLGGELKTAIAFGDNFNDVEMLQTVGQPYLMGNAPEKMKELFPVQTDDNDSEGIYKVLEKLLREDQE